MCKFLDAKRKYEAWIEHLDALISSIDTYVSTNNFQHLRFNYHVSGTTLGPGDTAVNKTETPSLLGGTSTKSQVGAIDKLGRVRLAFEDIAFTWERMA